MPNTIGEALNARRVFIGMSMQQLADKVRKDISTVSRQLGKQAESMQLASACLLADALGGRIVFLTDDALAEVENSDLSDVRQRFSELGAELERQKAAVEQLKDMNARLQSRVDAQEEIISRKDAQIADKDRIIERKDARLAQLYDKILESGK